MGFLDSLGTFIKKMLFSIGGVILALLSFGIMMIGATTTNYQLNPNPIMSIIGLIVLVVGLAMIAYAFKLKE